MNKVGVSVLAVVALSGCVTPGPQQPMTAEAARGGVTTQYDEFKKLRTAKGPSLRNGLDEVFLRAWKKDGADAWTYQVYAVDFYDGKGWKFLKSAWDDGGASLSTTVIARDVGTCGRYGCGHYEHVGIDVTRAYLEKAASTGMRFKLSGNGGEEIFQIPGPYVQGFLEATK